MALPAYLGENQFAIYGNNIAQNLGLNGIVPPAGLAFGTVYQIWDGDGIRLSVGDEILVKDEPVCRLAYDNGTWNIYTFDKIVLTEIPPVDPP